MTRCPLPALLSSVLVLAGTIGAAEPEPGSRPNVLFLLVDALRPDHLGCYGYKRETSPGIDHLARQAILFENAHAQSPWTKPSIPTLFTSLYPAQHGVYEGERESRPGHLESDVLPEECHTLAEILRDSGYRTAAFVNNAHLREGQGVDQGFEIYEQGGHLLAPDIHQRFLDFLGREDSRPFFAYLHYLDVHWPFDPSPPFATLFPVEGATFDFGHADWRGLRDRINDGALDLSVADRQKLVALHDGGIAELDSRIGALLVELRRRGLLENTLVVFTSDHGEELFDHGKVGHGGTLFEEVVRIPLIVRLPGPGAPGRVTAPVRLLDVLPTILTVAGIPVPKAIEGTSLVGAPLRNDLEIVAETRHKRTYKVSVRRGRWKLVREYRSTKPDSVAASGGTIVVTGQRIKAELQRGINGTLIARELRLRDAADDDLEVTAPLEEVSRERGSLRLLGTEFDVSGLGSAIPWDDLMAGLWVKIEGEPRGEGRVSADKLERNVDPELEVEGIVHEVAPGENGRTRINLGGLSVVGDERTRRKGFPEPAVEVRADSHGERRETPAESPPEILSEILSEALYDLERDPGEKTDVVGSHPEEATVLRRDLEAWLDRMARTRVGTSPGATELDAETIDRLRELGYIR